MKKYALVALISCIFITPISAQETSPQKPNILIIFADDLGYGDLSSYGAKYNTQALDQLAAEGLRSLDMIVPANVCSPSRAAILTGRYPMRNGLPIYRTNDKSWEYALHPDEITIAELLKPAGYHSLAIGKWHIGFERKGSHPLDAGFHSYYGLAYNYSKKHGPENMAIYRDHKVEDTKVPFPALTTNYNKEVIKFIKNHDKKHPFFIYLAHQIAHTPILPSKPFKGKTKKGPYADLVTELDHSTGEILQALKDTGQDQNTLIIFLADNGHTGTKGSGGPLAGGKYTTMEGGHRVPAIFRWPGKIPAGIVSNTTISSMDLLPLICHVAGVTLLTDRKIDGKNIINILQGKSTESPHKFLYYYNGQNLQAIRMGKWKLHLPRTAQDQPYWGKAGKSRRFLTLDTPFLVNLETDIGETKNLAPQNPEIVTELLKEATRIRLELGDVNQQGTDQRPLYPTKEEAKE